MPHLPTDRNGSVSHLSTVGYCESHLSIRLLGSFELTNDGMPIETPVSVQKLLALLAIEHRPIARQQASGVLWPEKTESRAGANLRSTLWRLKQLVGDGVVDCAAGRLCLSTDVAVDIHQIRPTTAGPPTGPFVSSATAALTASLPIKVELLSDWYDEWVVVERERVRQQTLRALETAVAELCRIDRFAEAIEVGAAAVKLAPLRESAHRAVMLVHLTEGNYAEAVRQYEICATALSEAFGIAPSDRLTALLSRFRNPTTDTG